MGWSGVKIRPADVAFWALVLFVASIPSEETVRLSGVGSLSRLLGMAALALGLLTLIRPHGRLGLRPPSLFLVIASGYLLWAVLSLFWALEPGVTRGRLITYTQLFVMAWLVYESSRSRARQAKLMQAFVLGAYVNVGIAVNTFFTTGGAEFRNVGADFNPNVFAMVLALAVPMAWHLSKLRSHPVLYWVNLLYLPAALVGVVLSASRGGLIALLGALLIIPLDFRNLGVLRKIALAALMTAVTVALFVEAPRLFPSLQTNFERLAGTSDELAEGTLTGRRVIWRAGMQVFREHSVLGVGAGGFRYSVVPMLGEPKAAHNAFVEALVDLGVIGLVLFLFLLVSVLLSILAAWSRGEYFPAVTFAVVITTFMSANSMNDKYAWFAMALLSSRPALMIALRRAPRVRPRPALRRAR